MSDRQEEMKAIVARLNDFEARYARAHSTHVRHPTPDNWKVLQVVGDEYEAEVQKCWDAGIIPVWNKTEETYKIE